MNKLPQIKEPADSQATGAIPAAPSPTFSKLLLCGAIAATLLWGASAQALPKPALKPKPKLLAPSSAAAELARATALLVEAQSKASSGDASWSWTRGGKLLAKNSGGLIALSLLRASGSGTTPPEAGSAAAKALFAATQWGEARLAAAEQWSELYDPDVEALAALSKRTGREEFQRAADQIFERRWGEASAEEALGRIMQLRRGAPSLVGYDLALVIRAAKATHHEAFAVALTDALLHTVDPKTKRLFLFSRKEAEGAGWETVSLAALYSAMEGLEHKGFERARLAILKAILLTQGRDGSFAQRNTQATAYAAMALREVDNAIAMKSLSRARLWLKQTQLKDGSWASFHDGLPEPFVGEVVHEVTAEVVLALAD